MFECFEHDENSIRKEIHIPNGVILIISAGRIFRSIPRCGTNPARVEAFELAIVHRNGYIDTHACVRRKVIESIYTELLGIQNAYEDTVRLASRRHMG